MKTNQIIIAFALLIIGGLMGSQFQHKLDQKPKSQKVLSAPDDGTNSPSLVKSGSNTINFIVGQEIKDIKDEETITSIEKLLSTDAVSISLKISRKGSANSAKDGNIRYDMGILEASRLAEMISKNMGVEPLFTASPKDDQECYSELQVITKQDSNIHSLEDLDKKNIAFNKLTIPFSFLTFKQLTSKHIAANRLHLYSDTDQEWAVANLNSNKVDALFERVEVYPDNKIVSKFGTTTNGSYAAFPNFKVIATTNYKIPCKIIAIRSQLSNQVKEEVKKKFTSIFSQPESKKIFKKNFRIGSLKEMTSEKWKPLQAQLEDARDFPLNSFAKEVILNFW